MLKEIEDDSAMVLYGIRRDDGLPFCGVGVLEIPGRLKCPGFFEVFPLLGYHNAAGPFCRAPPGVRGPWRSNLSLSLSWGAAVPAYHNAAGLFAPSGSDLCIWLLCFWRLCLAVLWGLHMFFWQA